MSDEEKEEAAEKSPARAPGIKLIVLTAIITLLAAVAGVALLVNILQRKEEARNPFYRVVELTDETEDPELWGKNFPMQYDGYKRTVDQVRTRYGGSEALPHTPTEADPRSFIAQSRLQEDPRLKTMWAGYAFSRDFREERGHAYMLTDQEMTERQQYAPQPGACIHCHASVYLPYKKAGGGDLIKGFEQVNHLPYPWFKGLKVDQIMAYYDEVGHKDWVHADTGAPVLKAQHPEFEMWNQGVHARSGVACADCHMPYTRVGALKISDHHVRSPLLNINNACQTCHKWPEDELRARVETIQGRTFRMRNVALDALLQLVGDIKSARDAGRSDQELAEARDFQRRAQFYLDFVEAENSTGFHAGQESVRILGESINFSRLGQLSLRGGIPPQPAGPPPTTAATPSH